MEWKGSFHFGDFLQCAAVETFDSSKYHIMRKGQKSLKKSRTQSTFWAWDQNMNYESCLGYKSCFTSNWQREKIINAQRNSRLLKRGCVRSTKLFRVEDGTCGSQLGTNYGIQIGSYFSSNDPIKVVFLETAFFINWFWPSKSIMQRKIYLRNWGLSTNL